MLPPVNTDLNKLDCWPLVGFAPGGYSVRCSDCRSDFIGDKRATQCLECAIKAVKTNVRKLYDDIRGLTDLHERHAERIVGVAVFHGSIISMLPPARHGHILHSMQLVMGIDMSKVSPENQGFVTNTGRFVGRVEAKAIARNAGQIKQESAGPGHPQLFSEDLW